MARKKKSRNWFFASVIILGLLLFAVYQTQFTVPDDVEEGDFISVPAYGFLRCEESQDQLRAPSSSWEMFDSATIRCANTGNTLLEECNIVFKMPSEEEAEGKYSSLLYSVCTEGSECQVNEGDVANGQVDLIKLYNFQEENENLEFTITLQEDQFIYAEYQESGLIGSPDLVEKGRYAIYYTPYEVVRYDTFSQNNGQAIGDSLDCAYDGSINEANFAILGSTSGLSLPQSDITNEYSLRSRGATITYLSNFVAIVPQYDLFDDDTKYCYDKKVYQVDEVETVGGTYKVANTGTNEELYSVECCNVGDVSPGNDCVNFEEVEMEDGVYCDILNPCPVIGYESYPGQLMFWQECVDNACETSYISVECSFNEDCPGGICSIDTDDPNNNKCIGGELIDYCGNGVCDDSLGENVYNCPDDCSMIDDGDDYTPYFIIGAFILIVAIMFVIAKRKGAFK